MSALAISIPEIQEGIFSTRGLSRTDLARALLVCKSWYLVVTPFLWRHIRVIVAQSNRKLSHTKLVHYHHWVKTLSTTSSRFLYWATEKNICQNLTVLNFGPEWKSPPHDDLMSRMIRQNQRLKAIRFCSFPTHGQSISELVGGLLSLKEGFLTTLELDSITINHHLPLVLNHFAGTIKVFKLIKCVLEPRVFEELSTLPKIQVLTLDQNQYLESRPRSWEMNLMHMARSMPALVEFMVKTSDPRVRDALSNVFGYFNQLESASLCFAPLEFLSPGDAIQRRFPTSLRQLSLNGMWMDHNCYEALKIFVLGARLTSIRMTGCISSYETWDIFLTNCPLLIEVCGDLITMMTVTKLTTSVWVCKNLKRFQMHFFVGTHKNNNLYEKTVLSHCRSVFEKLTELVQLKILSVNLYASDRVRNLLPVYPQEIDDECLNDAAITLEDKFSSMWTLLDTLKEIEKFQIMMVSLPVEMVNLRKLKRRTRKLVSNVDKGRLKAYYPKPCEIGVIILLLKFAENSEIKYIYPRPALPCPPSSLK